MEIEQGHISKDEEGLQRILQSNDIEEIHSIAQELLQRDEGEEQNEPKGNFVDNMVKMKMGEGQAENQPNEGE